MTDETGQEWFVNKDYALFIKSKVLSPDGDSMIVQCLDSDGDEMTITATKIPEIEDDGA